jgi:hypothetical protein
MARGGEMNDNWKQGLDRWLTTDDRDDSFEYWMWDVYEDFIVEDEDITPEMIVFIGEDDIKYANLPKSIEDIRAEYDNRYPDIDEPENEEEG